MKIIPSCLFSPDTVEADIDRRTISGGESISGNEDMIATDGGGRVFIEMAEPYLDEPAVAKVWRAASTYLEGGATPAVVPLCDANHQPVTEGSCGSTFSEYTDDYSSGIFAVSTASAALRATSITVTGIDSLNISGGEWFSIDHPVMKHRMYRIIDIDGDTITFRPPLREAVGVGKILDFIEPKCIMRLDGEMRSPSVMGYAEGSPVRFVEHFPGQDGYDAALTIATPSQAITNYFDPENGGEQEDVLYNATGDLAAVQAFAIPGMFPVTGSDFTFSVGAGLVNWRVNSATINFYDDDTPIAANLVSATATGSTLLEDGQTVVFIGSNTPVGATWAGISVKYAQNIGGSLIYSADNIIPAGALADLLPRIMVNYDNAAVVLSAHGAPGTVDTISTALSLNEGEFLIAKHGDRYFYRHPLGSAHLVHRTTVQPATYDYNPNYQFESIVDITSTEPGPSTVGAFVANFAVTPDTHTYYIQNDNPPAYKINGIFLSANHGIPSWRLEAAAHGKTNANARGQWLTKGGRRWKLTRIVDTDHVDVTAEITGDDEEWTPYTVSPGTGTFVWDSLGSNTSDIVATALSPSQLYPHLQGFETSTTINGSQQLTLNGAYIATSEERRVSYRVPNAKATLDYVQSQIGVADDIYFNDSSIESQLSVRLNYLRDGYGITTVRHEVVALQDHFNDMAWAMQNQALTRLSGSGETLHFFMNNILPHESGVNQDGGGLRDFRNVEDISANAAEYYARNTYWAPGSDFTDGIQRAPNLFMMGVKNSGGDWIKKWVYANDDDQGITSTSGRGEVAHLLTIPNKGYPAWGWERDVIAGQRDVCIGAFGPIDPDFDPEAMVNLVYKRFDGTYRLMWYRTDPTPLVDYRIPITPRLIGKRIRIVAQMTTVDLPELRIDEDGPLVSTTGAGGFSVVLY